MFPLHTKTFPPDAVTLRDALEDSLRDVVRAPPGIVSIEENKYPDLQAIRVLLDGAQVSGQPPPPPAPAVGQIEPALRVERFEISGQPVFVEGAAINFACTAREVQIGQGRDNGGNLLLLLQRAANGSVEISLSIADLERLLETGAKREAAKHGVTVEQLKVQLRSRNERALDAEVQVRARKLFLSATVRVTGSIEIDDRLNARLSGLNCSGEGALGSLACNFLAPQLERFNNRAFSLMALPLGEVQLREITISATDKLAITSQFGNPA